MAAYAASAHIQHATPHRVGPERVADAAVAHLGPRPTDAEPEDLTVLLYAGLAEDREPDLVALWSETTFFLFDPESWR